MSLTLPTVSVTVGPTYATQLRAALLLVEEHDHTSGKGVQVPTAGININANLSFGGYSATALKATTYSSQVSSLATAHSLYSVNGDLYWTNEDGTAIQVTSDASLNTSALITAKYASLAVSTNITIQSTDAYAHYRVNTAASRTITLPSASAVGAGRYYTFKDVTGSAASFPFTLSRAGSDTIDGATSYVVATNYGSVRIVSDGTSAWRVVGGGAANEVNGPTLSFQQSASSALIQHITKGSGDAGSMTIAAQYASAGNGGALTLVGGQGAGSSKTGGAVTISGGDGSGTGGAVTISSGGGTTATCGLVDLYLGATPSLSAQRMLRLFYSSDEGGHYAIIGGGSLPALFGSDDYTPSVMFSNATTAPDRTAWSGASGFLLTSISGSPYFTLGGGSQIGFTGVTAASVGGSQTHKIAVVANGTTYYIPLHTA